MDIKTKVESLVLIADGATLGFSLAIPEELKGLKILPSTVEKYAPDISERVLHFSWAYAYRRWRNLDEKNFEKSIVDFQNLCMTPAGSHFYTNALSEIWERLPGKVTLEYLKLALG
jgi:hypothetical protein